MFPSAGVLLAVFLGIQVNAQDPPRLVSPEVRPDRTVVFRFWAPTAKEVRLSGDWVSGPPIGLVKSADGVWTATQGPLEPNIYQYAFLVDGVRTDDSSCRCTYAFGAGRGASSRFTIAAQPPSPWEGQNRPPGTLHHERFFSQSQQRMRGFVVYTPPGYDVTAPRRYPVLVLLAGAPGDETEWTSGGGFAEVLFDNLIAAGRMAPAIVVMHASDVDSRASTRRGDANLGQFEKILVAELLPLVRQRYAVRTDVNSWAIAGLSLGGEFGMYVGLRHPELFGNIGSISGSLVAGGDPEEGLPSMAERFGSALARPDVARNYKLIWIGCGTADNVCRGSRVFAERLEAARVPHTWREYSGAHQMPVFRHELVDFVQLLFR
ncbi:MAG TPA: alpha/beta hydrolase-fold protein [Vicinamibacterales bacterium]|nr:alpha/beta hydrolase-fold protein [Vicinamibacterales bacterium]